MNPRTKPRWPRNWTVWVGSLVFALIATVPAVAQSLAGTMNPWQGGKIVVADRGSGTLTVISTHTDMVADTLDLPTGANPPEPMYVYYTPIRNRFFVGDRANDRVVVYSARTLEVVATVPAGAGVFHMWGNTVSKQLWVNNDIDNTSTVIDMRSLETIATVPTPADLVAAGGKPHDVILAPAGGFAYVTVLGVAGDNDYVVQYCTETFEEVGRAPVGQDPHVSLTWRNQLLYVPCQNTNEVHILNRLTMATVDVLTVPGAHGAGMPVNGRHFYTTNLSGGGAQALWTIDTEINQVIGEPVDAPYAVPHNIALTPNGPKLYVTHSGSNDNVSVYRVYGSDPIPVLVGEVTTGLNPFGLAWVP
jgi:DNA-binding beta-propeller fold protein YncE